MGHTNLHPHSDFRTGLCLSGIPDWFEGLFFVGVVGGSLSELSLRCELEGLQAVSDYVVDGDDAGDGAAVVGDEHEVVLE